jgi:hypothetical protein
MYLRTQLIFGFTILTAFMWRPAAAVAVDQVPWIRSQWFDEQFFTSADEPRTRIHVNAPAADGMASQRATRLVVYALPNGNTIEQTLGCRLADGMDWHYDIQHVAAQLRLLRSLQPHELIALICAEAEGLSWPNWRRTQPDANATIARMVESWRQRFGTKDCRVTLTGHSGGGSFMFGVVEAAPEIPAYIDRIAFLDANYAFDAPLHADKFARWLTRDKSHRLFVLAYDDREITLDGRKVVGPTGGTYRATGRMREALSRTFSLKSIEQPPFQETFGLDGRIRFYVHENPVNEILHTALVGEMNGLVHVQTLGTPAEAAWGTFGGPRAYDKWIQPEPTQPILDATGSAGNRPQIWKLELPPRSADAICGTAFIDRLQTLELNQREAAILREITSGNFPEFLRTLKSVPIRGKVRDRDDGTVREVTASLQVIPDYLAVGSDADFVRMPTTPQTAQQIADRFGCILPTRKIVDAIDEQAELHLSPHPLTKDREAVATFLEHHRIIEQQRAEKPLSLLTIGIKKDIVLSPRIFERPQRLAIYGWRQLDGLPIQPLTIVHSNRYVDYSHGARLVLNEIEIDGKRMKITEVLADPNQCGLVSDEGPMNPPVYPLADAL